MSAEAYDSRVEQSASDLLLDDSAWTKTFHDKLSTYIHGDGLGRLIEPKYNIHSTVVDFAADMLPPEAIELTPYAHLAEQIYNPTLGKNIRRSLQESIFESSDYDDEQKLYIAAIISDLAHLGEFSKQAYLNTENPVQLREMADMVRSINIETMIIKSALDYSNFQLLDSKTELSAQEAAKLERTIASKRYIDTILLEILGFDALAAEMLSRVYMHELRALDEEGMNDERYIDAANRFFAKLGGREALGNKAHEFLGKLFSHDAAVQYEVTNNQTAYNMHFTDGEVTIDTENGPTTYRTLTRLKSVGATAIKMRKNANRHPDALIEDMVPADIIGITFVARDNASIEDIITHTLEMLAEQGNAHYVSAPGRDEIVHIKGSQSFIDTFTRHSSVFTDRNLTIKEELCDNGYEAGKVTIVYDGCPIEMQFTHEASRQASRTGLGLHTLFKLMKLLDIDSTEHLTEKEVLAILTETSQRKMDFSPDRLSIVRDSKARAEHLMALCAGEAQNRRFFKGRKAGSSVLHIVR